MLVHILDAKLERRDGAGGQRGFKDLREISANIGRRDQI
jgi:hypothetical protein